MRIEEREIGMYEKAGLCASLLFLAVMTEYDVKSGEIPVAGLLAGMAAAVWYFAAGRGDTLSLFFAVLPGAVLLFLGLLTEEGIGYGDGMAALVLGLFLGGFWCVMVLSFGILLTGIFAMKRVFGKSREPIPLMPFLLAALEVVLIYV
jgi:polyferredoxin